MKKGMVILFRICSVVILLLLSIANGYGQNCKIYGVIKNNNTLSNVNISIPELNINTISDNNGHYEILNLPSGGLTLKFSHLGYSRLVKSIKLQPDDIYELNIKLEELIIELNEAEVISTKNEQYIREIPLPIELVTSTKITNSNQNTISDILKNESGISIIKDSPWGTSINIRGLSKQNIVYLINGNRIETSTNIAAGLSLIDINDIQSIEVVKGGLSSLYGTGATGGVVNIISNDLEFSQKHVVNSQLNSSYNSVNNSTTNSLNFKYSSNNLTAKFNGTLRKANNTETPNGILDNSSYNDEALNFLIKYSPLNNMIMKIDYQKFSAFDVGIPGGAPFPNSAIAKYKYAKREMISGSLIINNISKLLIKSEIKYYGQEIGRSVEIRPNNIVTSVPKATHITNGIVLQSDWKFSENNYLIAGLDYWQREYNGIRTNTNSIQNLVKVDKPVPNSKFESIGIFVQDEFNAYNNKLKISLSGRYDIINISNEETLNPLYIIKNGEVTPVLKIDDASFNSQIERNKSLSGGIGTIYKLSKEYDITFNTGYNFRSPSLEERYQYIDLGGIIYLGNPTLKPEEGIFLDTGFRVWMDKFNMRVNAFINNFSNLVQDISVIPDSLFKKQNIGKARLYGFDLSLDYAFYKKYLAYIKLAYVRGENINTNSNLTEIPPFNGSVGFKIPISGFFNIDLTSTFSLAQNNVGYAENKTKGFTYFDISFMSNSYAFSFMNLKMLTGVQNIFNKEYREHLSTYRGIKIYEPGRNIFVKLIIGFE